MRSVALGIWIRIGSRYESPEQAGISHFLEHLLFKGTDRFSSREIDETFDAHGRRGQRRHRQGDTVGLLALPRPAARPRVRRAVGHGAAPDLPGHRLRAPGGDRGDRHVRGRAADKVHDVLSTAVFGDQALGRPVIGTRRGHRRRARCPRSRAYHDEHYTAPNMVVAAAGNVDHERVVELVAESRSTTARRARRDGLDGAGARRSTALVLPREGDRAVPPLRSAGRACPAATTAASPCGSSTRPRRLEIVAAVPGGAREARPGLLGRLLRQPVRRRRPGRHLRGHARPTTSARRWRSSARELRRVAADGSPPRSSSARARTSRAARCWRWSRRSRA